MNATATALAKRVGNGVGDKIASERGNWVFNQEVAEQFVSHAERSIPGYHQGHDLVCDISDYFCIPNSVGYELGTSTGQLLKKLALHNQHKDNIRWVGIDNQNAMLDQARAHCGDVEGVEFVCDDILLHSFEPADFMVSYYVIQFVPPRRRQDMIDRVYQALKWGGGFVWFEKVRGPDARFQDMLSNLYVNFKLRNGFTPDEIINKAESLRGVMEPFSSQGNLDLLKRAGFVDIMPIHKSLCFEGLICIK